MLSTTSSKKKTYFIFNKKNSMILFFLKRFDKFVNKRKECFGRIADQHQYLLRSKFKDLMEKHHFDDCDIKIDHKKEELEIIVS
jgi:hypothetical protein